MPAFAATTRLFVTALLAATITAAGGCRSTTHAQPAAVPGATALGTSLDDIDARNRADIATQLGRPVSPGPATPVEVADMTRAGVEPRFIISYINRSVGMEPINAQDVIYLHNQGVSEEVIQAMLTPGAAYPRTDVVRIVPAPRMVIVEDPYWPYGYPYSRYSFGYGCGCRCY